MNVHDADEIMRLASLLATARVRRFAVGADKAGVGETKENTTQRVANAEAALRTYLEPFIERPTTVPPVRPPVRSAPMPPREVRLTAKDRCGNIYYLVVGERVYLTNPGRVPLCLSNIFADGTALDFRLRDNRGNPQACLRIVRDAPGYATGWELV